MMSSINNTLTPYNRIDYTARGARLPQPYGPRDNVRMTLLQHINGYGLKRNNYKNRKSRKDKYDSKNRSKKKSIIIRKKSYKKNGFGSGNFYASPGSPGFYHTRIPYSYKIDYIDHNTIPNDIYMNVPMNYNFGSSEGSSEFDEGSSKFEPEPIIESEDIEMEGSGVGPSGEIVSVEKEEFIPDENSTEGSIVEEEVLEETEPGEPEEPGEFTEESQNSNYIPEELANMYGCSRSKCSCSKCSGSKFGSRSKFGSGLHKGLSPDSLDTGISFGPNKVAYNSQFPIYYGGANGINFQTGDPYYTNMYKGPDQSYANLMYNYGSSGSSFLRPYRRRKKYNKFGNLLLNPDPSGSGVQTIYFPAVLKKNIGNNPHIPPANGTPNQIVDGSSPNQYVSYGRKKKKLGLKKKKCYNVSKDLKNDKTEESGSGPKLTKESSKDLNTVCTTYDSKIITYNSNGSITITDGSS